MRQFDKAIRALIKAKSISQADVAKTLKISTAAVSMALTGRIRFPAARLDGLFSILGLPDIERKHLRLLYLSDLTPEPLAGVIDSVRTAVMGLDERMEKVGRLADGLLYAEEAFDKHLGTKLAVGPKKAYFASVLDRFLNLGMVDKRTHGQLRMAIEKARAPVDFARILGRMLARLIRLVAGVKDLMALDKLLRLVDTDYVDHLAKVAGDVARRGGK